jgi:RNA polymerase sigma-70 factor (ECF subfamily)
MPTLHPDTRQSLILRLRNTSDVAAWRQFSELYGPVIYRVARRSGIQDADAQDIVQDVLWGVARAVERWEPQGPARFRTWLAHIVRAKLVDRLRRRGRQVPGLSRDDGGEQLARAQDRRSGLSELIESEYRAEVLRRAAEHVRRQAKPATWEAFWLTSVQGLSAAETADRLSMSVGAVYIARSRALARLRSAVEELT